MAGLIEAAQSDRSKAIADLYKTTLGRDADAGGLEWYANSGKSLEQIQRDMAGSSEASQRSQAAAPTAQGINTNYNGTMYDPSIENGWEGNSGKSMDEQIREAYRDVLGRDADQAGLDWWKQSGKGIVDVARGLADSSEFRSQHPNGGTLESLYRNVLERDPDSSGLNYYQNKGGNFIDAVGSFYDSDEYKRGRQGNAHAVSDQTSWPGAVSRDVNKTDDTVRGQLDSLLSENSPYIQQARARAQSQAAERGLINSTLAAQAGEEAAIGQAMPIASQDAETYFKQGLTNQGYTNQFNMLDRENMWKQQFLDQQYGEADKDRAWRDTVTDKGYNYDLFNKYASGLMSAWGSQLTEENKKTLVNNWTSIFGTSPFSSGLNLNGLPSA